MGERVRLPRALGFDRDYWLRRCEGFCVEGPDGRLGVVEEVRFGSRPDRPDVLVVRAGCWGGAYCSSRWMRSRKSRRVG